MYALSRGIIASTPEIDDILIFSDSSSALQTILDPEPHPVQAASLIFRRNAISLMINMPHPTVVLRWCPGNASISGNEGADPRLARDSAARSRLIHSTSAWYEQHSIRPSSSDGSPRSMSRILGEGTSVTISSSTTPSRFYKSTCEDEGSKPQRATATSDLSMSPHIDRPFTCPCADPICLAQTRLYVLFVCPLHERAHSLKHLGSKMIMKIFDFKIQVQGLPDYLFFPDSDIVLSVGCRYTYCAGERISSRSPKNRICESSEGDNRSQVWQVDETGGRAEPLLAMPLSFVAPLGKLYTAAETRTIVVWSLANMRFWPPSSRVRLSPRLGDEHPSYIMFVQVLRPHLPLPDFHYPVTWL